MLAERTPDDDEHRSELHRHLDYLIDNTRGDPGMRDLVVRHITLRIPALIKRKRCNREAARLRAIALRSQAEVAVAGSQHLYAPGSRMYMAYDRARFFAVNDDEVRADVLARSPNIGRSQRPLVTRHALRLIREKAVTDIIPESATIQLVLSSLCRSAFDTRNAAKMFLCAVGERMTAVQPQDASPRAVYHMPPSICALHDKLQDKISAFTLFPKVPGAVCRGDVRQQDASATVYIAASDAAPGASIEGSLWPELVCVASHYARRYGGAFGFLDVCGDRALRQTALATFGRGAAPLVAEFCRHEVRSAPQHECLELGHADFAWSHFLRQWRLPPIVAQRELADALQERSVRSTGSRGRHRRFHGLISPVASTAARFAQFWHNNMIRDGDGEQLEVAEVASLFHEATSTRVDEGLMLSLINHFHPGSLMPGDRVLARYRCTLWDKRGEVEQFLERVRKEGFPSSPYTLTTLYGRYICEGGRARRVAQDWFRLVARRVIGRNIGAHGVVSGGWWKSHLPS